MQLNGMVVKDDLTSFTDDKGKSFEGRKLYIADMDINGGVKKMVPVKIKRDDPKAGQGNLRGSVVVVQVDDFASFKETADVGFSGHIFELQGMVRVDRVPVPPEQKKP